METPRQFVIADNQYLITRSLSELLCDKFSFSLREIARNRKDLDRLLSEGPLELLIIDINQFDLKAPADIKKILLGENAPPVMILTNSLTRSELAALHSAGIKNILFKTSGEEELIAAVEYTLQGRKYFGRDVMELLIGTAEWTKNTHEATSLTTAEIEIVKLIADGMTTKEIALRKHVSFHTIMTHRKNIFRKANVNNASELVMFAIRAGIIDTIEYQI